MLFILATVLPIFALILAGWGARRLGVLGPHATGELNRFVVYLALPALLFDIVAHAKLSDIWQPGFVAAFGSGMMLVFVVALAVRLRRGALLPDAAVDGLNAAYGNTGFIGFPLALSVIGTSALVPVLITTILTVCILFAGALILIEIGVQTERHPRRMIAGVSASLARNPLLVAPAAGAVFLCAGIAVPGPVEQFLKLLGAAASPCALVALGLFLAQERTAAAPARGNTAFLVVLKLLGQPVATWLLATRVFGLTPALTHAAVLVAALPTGTGPFMVAELYRREAATTSRVILISTIASLATITAYLALAG